MTKRRASFCPYCGSSLERRTFEGRDRTYCPDCESFIWQNPVPGARVVVFDGDEVLFIKRGQEPYRGVWALPAGILEVDEPASVGAARELREETNLHVDPEDLTLVRTGFDVDDPDEGSFLSICFAVQFEKTTGQLEAGSEPDAVRFWDPGQLQSRESARTRSVSQQCIEAARDRLGSEPPS